jgi:hypothetical protein
VSSKTRVTTFRRIAAAGDIAPLLLQLMMAVNDMGIADDGLRHWSGPQPPGRQDRAPRARSYFVRLQMAHAFEGLKVIGKIARTPDFMKLVEKCDAQTLAAFKRLMTFIGTDEYKAMRRMRNAITSHYLAEPIAEAIDRQVDKFPDAALSMSIGSHTLDWHFEPGDQIVDSIIVRHAIGIQSYPVVSAEIDDVASRLQTIAEDLMNFSGYFVPRYCSKG